MSRLLVLFLLRHRLAQGAHALTQRLHGLRLIVDRFGQIIVSQRVLCIIHSTPGPVQRITRSIPFGRSLPRQTSLLAA